MEKEIAESTKNYDFVRFTIIDIHGISRCKTISKSGFDSQFKNGTCFYVGKYSKCFFK